VLHCDDLAAPPLSVIGDASSAAERAADPAGWAFPACDQEALGRILAGRRDVRRYRPDAVPAEAVERVLAAAHLAPSVGHSQPWRFIVVRDPSTRERAALTAERERQRQAAQLDAEAGRRMLDLQLDGIHEAPVGIVVCCDRRAPAAGVLGRATFPDADLWSCAAAIKNAWLTARSVGLGRGWVTLFPPAELAAMLSIPEGVETLGWLCLGWPDERPPEPGLERAGWSRRQPLADVVLNERWPEGDRRPPRSRLRAPDPAAVVAARDGADVLLTPPRSLGVLDRVLDGVVAAGAGGVTGGTLLLVGTDHPVARHPVSAFAQTVTRDVLAAALAGTAMGVTAARGASLAVTVVDAGIDGAPLPGAHLARPAHQRGDLATRDALDALDLAALLAEGRALGARAATGLTVLGEVAIGGTTVGAALAAGLLGLDAGVAVGVGAGGDSAMVGTKAALVTLALERTRHRRDPLRLLGSLGGAEVAVLAGVVLGAAAAGGIVVLDGLVTGVAALVATRLEPACASYLVAGQRSSEGVHALVRQELGLEPLLNLRLRAGEGVGACLAAGLLLGALRLRRETARTDAGSPTK